MNTSYLRKRIDLGSEIILVPLWSHVRTYVRTYVQQRTRAFKPCFETETLFAEVPAI